MWPSKRPGRPTAGVCLLGAFGLLAATCAPAGAAPDERSVGGPPPVSTAATNGVSHLPPVELDVRPGFGQVTIAVGTDDTSDPFVGQEVAVVDGDGTELGRSGVAGNGTALIRDLPPGPVGLRLLAGGEVIGRGPDLVLPGSQAPPSEAYHQPLVEGYQYLEVRDGTTLSAHVTLPGPVDGGPYPTLVEYSGYAPSDPGTGDRMRRFLPMLGYALVQVNVRGTGCSGGSFDAFEPIQGLDGYDVIEIVATQPWSAAVGMWGISYPGIMQLHVAATRPPSLSAIAPLSVLDKVDSVLFPGGIPNVGFGERWTAEVGRRAEAYGQPWTERRAAAGDTVCAENQELRIHNPDLVGHLRASPFRSAFTESRSPQVSGIDVPVFIAGAWQDEQTGGRFASLLPELADAPVLRAVLYNGLHADPFGPHVLSRVLEFYDLYVADRSPRLDTRTRLTAGAALTAAFGEFLPIPVSAYADLDPQTARARYAAAPSIEVLFEVGAPRPNLPVPAFIEHFEAWPPEETRGRRLYLGASGTLDERPPPTPDSAGFVTDPEQARIVTAPDPTRILGSSPGWVWPAGADDLTFTSPAFAEDTLLLGSASADLVVSVEGNDADLEVTLSEVAPDGGETYVQSGWLRLSLRSLDPAATDLAPIISGRRQDVSLLSPDEPVDARVEILPFAHVIRRGSRLRLTIDTPGASQPLWTFDVGDEATAVTVHTGPDGSSLLIGVVDGIAVPPGRPACGSLRGQPCRSPDGR